MIIFSFIIGMFIIPLINCKVIYYKFIENKRIAKENSIKQLESITLDPLSDWDNRYKEESSKK